MCRVQRGWRPIVTVLRAMIFLQGYNYEDFEVKCLCRVLTSTLKQGVMALLMGHKTLFSHLRFSLVCTQRAPHFRRCGTVAKMSGLILWLKSHCHAAPGLSLDNGMPSKFSSFGQEIVVLLFSQKSQGDFFYDVSRDQMIAFPLRL